MRRSTARLLALFPSLAFDVVGGVQTSGRVAWAALSALGGGVEDPTAGRVRLFCFGESRNGGARRETGDSPGTYSKLEAVLEALRTRWSADTMFVWHLALLRLLPFFRVPGARVLAFLHGIEAWQRQDWLTRSLLRRVDVFLSNSAHTWERFVSVNPACAGARHEVVHLGVGMPVSARIPPPAPVPVALMVGRLMRGEDYKGHREMIVAWPGVVARIPGAELWIVGDGDSRRDLERAATRLGCADRIRFWGQVSDARKEDLFAACRCLALPSRGEGFGLVYLEAMRLGRPCLVGLLDAGREVVNPPEAGLAADPRDPVELVEAVCRLLTLGPEWEGWSEGARRRYEGYFTAEHFQSRLIGALSRVAREPRGPGRVRV